MSGPDTQTAARVTVNLPPKVWEAVEAESKEDSLTRTDVLRRAISVAHYLREQIRGGAEILVRQPDGSLERLVFPFV